MRNVEASIEINVVPAKAILAFIDEGLLKAWWGVERTLIEAKQGGPYTLAWGISQEGIKYISTGTIREYHPSRILHIENYIYLNPDRSFLGPMELKIETVALPSGCKLSLSQGPYLENTSEDWDWYYERVKEAWPQVLVLLKKFLEEKFAS